MTEHEYALAVAHSKMNTAKTRIENCARMLKKLSDNALSDSDIPVIAALLTDIANDIEDAAGEVWEYIQP